MFWPFCRLRLRDFAGCLPLSSFRLKLRIPSSIAPAPEVNLNSAFPLQTPAGRIKNTHLPFIAMVGAGVLSLVRLLKPTVVLLYVIGAYAGWIYLRYFQRHSNGSKVRSSPRLTAEHSSFKVG